MKDSTAVGEFHNKQTLWQNAIPFDATFMVFKF